MVKTIINLANAISHLTTRINRHIINSQRANIMREVVESLFISILKYIYIYIITTKIHIYRHTYIYTKYHNEQIHER